MQFLYFVPNLLREDVPKMREAIIAAGLGDVLRDRLANNDLAGLGRLAIASITNGPGGHSGLILQAVDHIDNNNPPPAPGYYPKQHTWERLSQTPPLTKGGQGGLSTSPDATAWIGYDPHDLPGPQDLERDQIISGYYQPLGDGHDWACPVIRMHLGKVNLPDVWRLVNGKIVSQIKPDWQWAWDLSGQIWDSHITGADPTVETAFLWCSKLLGINYRIGPVEASILGLLGRDELPGILRAAIHGPFVEWAKAELKKSDPASSVETPVNSTPGAEASTLTTVPAEANCTSPPTESANPNPSP